MRQDIYTCICRGYRNLWEKKRRAMSTRKRRWRQSSAVQYYINHVFWNFPFQCWREYLMSFSFKQDIMSCSQCAWVGGKASFHLTKIARRARREEKAKMQHFSLDRCVLPSLHWKRPINGFGSSLTDNTCDSVKHFAPIFIKTGAEPEHMNKGNLSRLAP